jgi:AMP phosphorylase
MFNEAGARDHGAALEIIRTGRAEKKMREIIEEQGGDPKIKPEEIPIGSNFASIKSNVDGKVLWIKNSAIVSIARLAGAPKDKGAGIYLNAKMGNPVKKNSILFTIYSNTYSRLNEAVKAAEELKPIVVGKQFEEKMLLDRVFSEIPTKTTFMLER